MKIQPAAGDGRSSTKVVLPEKENAVPVLKLYYQRIHIQRPPETAVPVPKLYYQSMKIQPAAGDGRSSTQVVLTENERPLMRGSVNQE